MVDSNSLELCRAWPEKSGNFDLGKISLRRFPQNSNFLAYGEPFFLVNFHKTSHAIVLVTPFFCSNFRGKFIQWLCRERSPKFKIGFMWAQLLLVRFFASLSLRYYCAYWPP